MAKVTFTGVDGTMARLNALQQSLKDRVIGKMVYDGAAVMADVVRNEIKALPTDNRFVKGGEMLLGPGDTQKKGLLESLGVTPFPDGPRDRGERNPEETGRDHHHLRPERQGGHRGGAGEVSGAL